MRGLIWVAGAAAILSACGDKNAGDSAAKATENAAAEAIFSNDTTAIDAATGDASNMAADVAYTVSNADNDGDVGEDGSGSRARSRQSGNTTAEPSQNSEDNSESTETPVDSNGV